MAQRRLALRSVTLPLGGMGHGMASISLALPAFIAATPSCGATGGGRDVS
jgi:hypothetical protein